MWYLLLVRLQVEFGWRNLGASRVASNSTDTEAFGDLYHDGEHLKLRLQKRRHTNVDASDFWNEPKSGLNDIIFPNGYRLPTIQE